MAGRTFAEGWPVYACWIRWVWAGQVKRVIEELLMDVAGGEHGLTAVGDIGLVAAAFEAAPAVGQLPASLSFHSKSLGVGTG
jgi:hypothetical protein